VEVIVGSRGERKQLVSLSAFLIYLDPTYDRYCIVMYWNSKRLNLMEDLEILKCQGYSHN